MKPIKYPSTPHWPWSEKLHRDDTYHSNPEYFLNVPVVITEKLDGGNTQLVNGKVYARSIQSPANHGWMAMVKKHHAWKTLNSDLVFYGEDIYGIHSIKYNAVKEDETFYLFAVLDPDHWKQGSQVFLSWSETLAYSHELQVPTVPVIAKNKIFKSLYEITQFFKSELKKPSVLGPNREGFVMRRAERINYNSFSDYICKYVRANHVQTSDHWTKNWKECDIIK